MDNKQKIINILDDYEISWWDSGKNVTRGWVNIQCPFPECGDVSNHCGICIDTLAFHCWKCGESGPFIKLLTILTGLSNSQCEELIKDDLVLDGDTSDRIQEAFRNEEEREIEQSITVTLPERFELVTKDTDFALLSTYLKRRKISIDTLIQHKCGICRSGSWMNRLIIPVYYQGKLVSFQGADMTGFAQVPYKAGTTNIHDFIYNYDNVKDVMILTEGVLDAWRIGDEAVALFSALITPAQAALIRSKGLKELFFCWDGDAYWKAVKAARELAPFVPTVDVIQLPYSLEYLFEGRRNEDPDSIGREEVYKRIGRLER